MEASTRVVVALGRLKDLFLEFPETLVSLDDAACFIRLEPHECHALLSALVDVRFLQRTPEGTYRLRYPGPSTGVPANGVVAPPAGSVPERPIAAA